MKSSIIIATYNRAKELAETLDGLRRIETSSAWEVIVSDNNSTDCTRQVVDAAAPGFPVPLKYVFERTQGKAAALNTAIREARGEVLVFTDDDALVEPDWLDRAGAALDETGPPMLAAGRCHAGRRQSPTGSPIEAAGSGPSSRCSTSDPRAVSSAAGSAGRWA